MLVETLSFEKNLIDVLHVHLLGGRQAERRALSPGGRTTGRASDPRERALDLMGKEEDRGSPVFILSIWSICDSHDHSENSLLKESFPGVKHTQWKPLTMRAVGPLESRLCMLHSQSDHAQAVCIPAVWCSVGREETHNL